MYTDAKTFCEKNSPKKITDQNKILLELQNILLSWSKLRLEDCPGRENEKLDRRDRASNPSKRMSLSAHPQEGKDAASLPLNSHMFGSSWKKFIIQWIVIQNTF